ncbi:MAG: protein kinase, partial [Gemmataceae bacterium]
MIRTVPDVESYCNLMNRSKLIKPKEIQNVYQDWRKRQARGAPGETDRFIDWLRQYHYLTPYQAQQLAIGRADHFFLNHYRLLDLIGKGKMAGIFKAAHSSLGHIVAIKVIPPAKSKDAVALARFRREAKMAVKLQHPNIVRTHHLGQVGARYYIVMEY